MKCKNCGRPLVLHGGVWVHPDEDESPDQEDYGWAKCLPTEDGDNEVDECQLVRRWVQGHNAVFFRYKVSDDCVCEFSLFSEVGAPWQPRFRGLMAEEGIDPENVVEINERPWLITVENK